MSPGYLKEAADWFADRGYVVREEAERFEPDDKGRRCDVVRYRMQKADERWALECVSHPSAPFRYFLEIENYGALQSPSFPLDSWRLHPDRIELKLGVDAETALGHSFVLRLGPPQRSTQSGEGD